MQAYMRDFSDIKKQVDATGAAIVNASGALLSGPGWAAVEELCTQVPLEPVSVGDVGEMHALKVGRLVEDGAVRTIPHPDLLARLQEILQSSSLQKLFQALLDQEKYYFPRLQLNVMEKGQYVGCHVDSDSNPDYDYSVVLQLGENFSGGAFVTHPENNDSQIFEPSYRSAVICRGDVAHEVAPVTAGTRTSLVFFLSRVDRGNPKLNRGFRPANAA